MATMSLELSSEIEQLACAAAAELGIGMHAFMVSAIRQAVEAVEQHAQLVTQGHAVQADTAQRGQLGQRYDAVEARAYLRARLADPAAIRPVTKPWRA